ncbi:uncharacterized protein A1O5_03406 [Cladophialophora psammophila CBS 110553]|uniref:Uncharacterized protein n=1 Tax=Cladophialophora psammophila CBS 110553 TaxID=1182543 RepID=W9XTM4_9EURO|nr:uncharacterized protein A1O5_03406 [Cladophialophora psammophila CBS 110553]EXJ73644.1 hypothetical protein A1O5_03406 [Cladophialophora psammophila CBS 110553]
MDHTTRTDGFPDFPESCTLPPGSHDTGSDGVAHYINMRDEWPSSRALARRYGRYDAQGFLVDFEHTTAYLQPRKAPSPPTTTCGSPFASSSLTSNSLVDHSSSRSEALIAIPYASTSESGSQSLAMPQIRFSEAYRKWWLEQYSRPKPPATVQLAMKNSSRANWQGFWLARGTLRGCDKVIEQHGPGYWRAKGTMKDTEQRGEADRSDGFWKRVVDKMRRISSEEK